MKRAIAWLKRRIAAVALSTACVITVLQTLTGGFLDFIFNGIVIGLLFAVIRLNRSAAP